jgi:glutathione synthase/RimK-type ligase-like ATP-grasp enzyme
MEPITEVQIPLFDRMREIAARCSAMNGLGYVGIDLVFDKDKGPLMLELNARPGLAIQIANRAGIGARLAKVDAAEADKLELKDRIAFATSKFAVSPK